MNVPQKPIGWLGTTPFALVTTLRSLSKNQRTVVVEHPIIGGKPSLQITGDTLEDVTITVQLHTMLCDVDTQIKQLEAIRAAHQATSLLWVSGEDWGDFIIAELQTDMTSLSDDGAVLIANVTVTLKEYVPRDDIASATAAAQQNAAGIKQ